MRDEQPFRCGVHSTRLVLCRASSSFVPFTCEYCTLRTEHLADGRVWACSRKNCNWKFSLGVFLCKCSCTTFTLHYQLNWRKGQRRILSSFHSHKDSNYSVSIYGMSAKQTNNIYQKGQYPPLDKINFWEAFIEFDMKEFINSIFLIYKIR